MNHRMARTHTGAGDEAPEASTARGGDLPSPPPWPTVMDLLASFNQGHQRLVQAFNRMADHMSHGGGGGGGVHEADISSFLHLDPPTLTL